MNGETYPMWKNHPQAKCDCETIPFKSIDHLRLLRSQIELAIQIEQLGLLKEDHSFEIDQRFDFVIGNYGIKILP